MSSAKPVPPKLNGARGGGGGKQPGLWTTGQVVAIVITAVVATGVIMFFAMSPAQRTSSSYSTSDSEDEEVYYQPVSDVAWYVIYSLVTGRVVCWRACVEPRRARGNHGRKASTDNSREGMVCAMMIFDLFIIPLFFTMLQHAGSERDGV